MFSSPHRSLGGGGGGLRPTARGAELREETSKSSLLLFLLAPPHRYREDPLPCAVHIKTGRIRHSCPRWIIHHIPHSLADRHLYYLVRYHPVSRCPAHATYFPSGPTPSTPTSPFLSLALFSISPTTSLSLLLSLLCVCLVQSNAPSIVTPTSPSVSLSLSEFI